MRQQPLYLCLDVGTSKLKGALISPSGGQLVRIEKPFSRARVGTYWIDQIAARVEEAVRELCELRHEFGRVVGIGMTTQMAGLVFLDDSQRPVMDFVPGVVPGGKEALRDLKRMAWQDNLDLHQTTGCPLEAVYPSVKMTELTRTHADTARSVRYVGGLKEYLLLRLTGEWVTDLGSASATQLLDQTTGTWLLERLKWFPWPEESYPRIKHPWEIAGTLRSDLCNWLDLCETLPVIVGTGDGVAGSISAGILDGHRLSLSLGTTAVVRWAEPQMKPLFRNEFRQMFSPSLFFQGVRVVGAGMAVEWAQKLFGRLGDEVPAANDSPKFRMTEDGWRWSGTKFSTKEEMLFSVYFGILEPLYEAAIRANKLRTLEAVCLQGGGAMDSVWHRLIADRFRAHVRLPENRDGTAGVAALLHMSLRGCELQEALSQIISHHSDQRPRETPG